MARLFRPGRRGKWWPEALLAPVLAVAAGLAATALDFGGWSEPDWRAGLFAFLAALAGIGLFRAVRLSRRGRIYERFR